MHQNAEALEEFIRSRMSWTSDALADALLDYLGDHGWLRVSSPEGNNLTLWIKRAEQAELDCEHWSKDCRELQEKFVQAERALADAKSYIEDFKHSIRRVSEENIALRTQLHAAQDEIEWLRLKGCTKH